MPIEVDILIQNGVVITVNRAGDIFYDGLLAIDKGRIVAVGPAERLAGQYVGRKTIDARQKAILPGLIDTHHHFLQNFLKGARDDLPFVEWIAQVSSPRIILAVEDYLKGDYSLQWHAHRIGCIEALRSGITCILNMEWATHPNLIELYEETGLRVVHTLTMTDVDSWSNPRMLLPWDVYFELADRLIERAARSQGGRVTFRYGPACENSASPQLIQTVRKLADRTGLKIHMHMAESKFGWENIHQRYGKTPIRYLYDLGLLGPDVLGAHGIWLSEEDIQILSDTGTSLSYNPECHMKIAIGISPVVQLLAAGVPISLGTDTCAVNDNMDMFEAMRVGAFLQKVHTMDPAVVPAEQSLRMATMGGARSLNMEDEIGSLETGKKADVILVDLSGVHIRPINNILNNLVYSASAAHDVETVIVDGRLVVEERRLLCFDEQAVLAEAEQFALERFSRAGLKPPPYYRQN